MTDPLDQEDAATPLTTEEQAGLIPSYITLRHELNEAEQANILEAGEWAFARKRDILDETLLKSLRKRMFGRVWRWAGEFRLTERNIGVAPHRIGIDLRYLLDGCRYWIEHGTYPPDEIAARFHHRLVWIHPFPNGNGRHARLAADLLLAALGQPRFSWGRVNLVEPMRPARPMLRHCVPLTAMTFSPCWNLCAPELGLFYPAIAGQERPSSYTATAPFLEELQIRRHGDQGRMEERLLVRGFPEWKKAGILVIAKKGIGRHAHRKKEARRCRAFLWPSDKRR